MTRFSRFNQQREILHVPGANLQNVHMAGNHRHEVRLHHFGNCQQTVFAPDLLQDLQPFLLQSLKGIRRRARFEGPSAQHGGTRFSSGLSRGLHLVDAFH